MLLRAIIIALLATCNCARAQAPLGTLDGGVAGKPGFVLPGAQVDLLFATNFGWQAGYGQGPAANFITTVRASTRWQPDLSGLLHSFPSGVAAITNVGLGVWQATTNEALYSRDLTNTAWTALNVTAAHTAVGADGSTNGGSKLTASAANGTILQVFTIGSEAQNLSVFVQRRAGSGEVDITENGGSTWTSLTSANCQQPGTLAASGIVTNGYVRCSVETTLANPSIGFRIVTNGDAVNVDFVQLENNTFSLPPCPSAGTSAACAADVVTMTYPPAFGSAYSLYASGTPQAPTSGSVQFMAQIDDGTGSNRIILERASSGDSMAVYEVAGSAVYNQVQGVMAQGVFNKTVISALSGTQNAALSGVLATAGTGVGTIAPSNIRIGVNSIGTLQFNGSISRVAINPTRAWTSGQLTSFTTLGNGQP